MDTHERREQAAAHWVIKHEREPLTRRQQALFRRFLGDHRNARVYVQIRRAWKRASILRRIH